MLLYRLHRAGLRFHLLVILVLLILLVLLPPLGDAQALAGELDLSAAEGRVDACQAPLVAFNDTCTCDAGATWQSNETHQACAPCAAGSYKPGPGLHACSACPPLMTSFEGAAEAADCLCVAGYQNASGACEACRSGSYKSFVGNNSCVACPANADTPGAASDALEDCLCLPGYVANSDASGSDEACAACPRNTFNDDLGGAACAACPVYSGTEAAASTSASCECEAGYTAGAGQHFCAACLPGQYKATRSMGACAQCPANMMSPAAASALANCTCNAGYEKTSPSTCGLCALDNYCPGADAKLACPGNSSAPRGADAIAACTCLPGFFWYHATCELCSEDHFCANNTRTACPLNSTAPAASVSIENCTCLPGFH
jgi:hypothetical protein